MIALAAIAVMQWLVSHLTPSMNPVVPHPGAAFTWSFAMKDGTSATPSVAGDTLFIASNDHRMYALDVRSGRLLWEHVAGNDVMTAPLVYRGVVIFGQGNPTPIVWDPPRFTAIGAGINADYGLDALTGAQRWYAGLPGTGMPTGAIVNGLFIRHDGSGLVVARDAITGTFRWKRYVDAPATMSAINVVNDAEIVTSGLPPATVLALRPSDGAILWRATFPAATIAVSDCPVATDGNRIYGMYLVPRAKVAGTFVQHVYALSAKDGSHRWDRALESGIPPPRNEAAIPMLHAGLLYDGSSISPWVHALDMRSGTLRWRRRVAGTVKGGFVTQGGVLYFGDDAGYLWALDARTGRVIGSKHMADTFNVGSPIVVGKTLIIGGKHRYVFALPLESIRAARDVPAAAKR